MIKRVVVSWKNGLYNFIEFGETFSVFVKRDTLSIICLCNGFTKKKC